MLAALSPDAKVELDRAFIAAQKEWHIVRHGLNIKRYPICYATHRSIDAVLDLIERHDLSPERVERIHVSTGKTQSLMLRNSRPQTGLEAKFSMQFAMAAALVARRVGLSELTDGFVLQPEVQAIFRRVSITTTTEGSAFAPADAVEITTNGGRRCRAGRSNSLREATNARCRATSSGSSLPTASALNSRMRRNRAPSRS